MKKGIHDKFDPFVSDVLNAAPESWIAWWPRVTSHQTQPAPTAVQVNQGIAPAAGASTLGSATMVTTGGINFDLNFTAAAMAAPTSFRAGIVQAATMLANVLSDKITVDLKIDYRGTRGGAAAGPEAGLYESYSLIRSDLIKSARLQATPLSIICPTRTRFRDGRTLRCGTPS